MHPEEKEHSENGRGELEKIVKLAIIVGHEKSAQGAKMAPPYGLTEYAYNTTIANKMKDLAPAHIKPVIIFRDNIGISGTYRKAAELGCDCAIELHFNAFNKKASGSETLCTQNINDSDFAHIVHKKMCEAFGRAGSSRGVKTIARSARAGGNVHGFPEGANCLVEPAFGDNPEEAKLLIEKQDAYAAALIQAVDIWARNIDLV